MLALLIISLLVNVALLVLLLRKQKKPFEEDWISIPESLPHTAENTGRFYDTNQDAFEAVYGEVIQAFRTTNVEDLLDHQIEQIGFEKSWKVLDAGCGIAGPARYFARKTGVSIDALTISQVQAERAKKLVEQDALQAQINVVLGDYHKLPELFEANQYDAVYFLESFGHAVDHQQVIQGAFEVLKPGGVLFIKDLFQKEPVIKEHEVPIQFEIDNINIAYHYNVADLYETLRDLRKCGFILTSLQTIDIPLEQFENLTISNQFQELTGINRIAQLDKYIFPVDFFEIKAIKPWLKPEEGSNRYFLQNRYYAQTKQQD